MERKKIYKVVAITAVLVVAAGLFLFGPGWSEEAVSLLAPKERIVFSSNHEGSWNIYTIAADGTEMVRLTKDRKDKDSKAPSFSPDGSRIIFYSNRDGNWELYTMNAIGSDVKRLTVHPRVDALGIYSPDGSKIVFHSNRSGNFDIFVMNADGSEPKRLTNDSATDRQPSWSPDGQKIVFVSDRDGNDEIYVMNADGGEPRRLTDNRAIDVAPRYSPDGTKIIFESDKDATVGQIRVMNADGSGAKSLTGGGNPSCGWTETSNHRPSFSADGRRIAYISFASTRWCGSEIFIMDSNGSNPRQITDIRGVPGERDYTGRIISTIDFPNFSPVPVPAPAK